MVNSKQFWTVACGALAIGAASCTSPNGASSATTESEADTEVSQASPERPAPESSVSNRSDVSSDALEPVQVECYGDLEGMFEGRHAAVGHLASAEPLDELYDDPVSHALATGVLLTIVDAESLTTEPLDGDSLKLVWTQAVARGGGNWESITTMEFSAISELVGRQTVIATYLPSDIIVRDSTAGGMLARIVGVADDSVRFVSTCADLHQRRFEEALDRSNFVSAEKFAVALARASAVGDFEDFRAYETPPPTLSQPD